MIEYFYNLNLINTNVLFGSKQLFQEKKRSLDYLYN